MLKVGQYVVAYGFKTKNDNDIYVVKSDYGNNSYCLYKVKLNGEESKAKYNILFLDERHFNDSTIKIKKLNGVEDLKQAKKEVNDFLKGVTSKEIVVTYSPSNTNELVDKGTIQVIKRFPTTKSIYKMPRGYYQISLLGSDRVVFRRLGKKGQVLSPLSDVYNAIAFRVETVKKLLSDGYMVVVEKNETTKGEIEQQKKMKQEIKQQKEESKSEKIQVEQPKKIKVKQIIF